MAAGPKYNPLSGGRQMFTQAGFEDYVRPAVAASVAVANSSSLAAAARPAALATGNLY